MKKFLTIALALICMAVLTGLAVAQGAQQKDKQKNPPTSSETKPTPTKPPAAETTGKWSRDNAPVETLTGSVTQANEKDKTFTLTPKGRWTGSWAARAGKEVNFSGRTLKALPAVGDVIDVTFIQTTSGGLQATTIRLLESNASKGGCRPKCKLDGTVTKVNEKDNTFTIMGDGRELTLRVTAIKTAELKRDPSGLAAITELKAFLKSGERVEVTYTENPGEPPTATAIKKAVDKPKETKLK